MEFTREKYLELCEASRQITAFKSFVLGRFLDYTKFTSVKASKTASVEPTKDIGVIEHLTDAHGYGGWTVNERTLFSENVDHFTVFHYLGDERGATTFYDFVNLPKDFVFGELEADEEYQEYLRLRAKFGD